MKRRVRCCLDCGWRIRENEREDPSVLVIEHAVETGHDVALLTESDRKPTVR